MKDYKKLNKKLERLKYKKAERERRELFDKTLDSLKKNKMDEKGYDIKAFAEVIVNLTLGSKENPNKHKVTAPNWRGYVAPDVGSAFGWNKRPY